MLYEVITYTDPTNPIEHYAGDIKSFLSNNFGDELPEIIIEPGRSMAGDCGIIVVITSYSIHYTKLYDSYAAGSSSPSHSAGALASMATSQPPA